MTATSRSLDPNPLQLVVQEARLHVDDLAMFLLHLLNFLDHLLIFDVSVLVVEHTVGSAKILRTLREAAHALCC